MNSYNKIHFIVSLLILIALISCSDEREIDKIDLKGKSPLEISINTKASLPDGLTGSVYIFRKETAEEYTLTNLLDLGTAGIKTLELENEYLTEDDAYRFLFTADQTQEIEIKNAEGGPLQVGDQWEGILLEAVTQNLSGDFYYEVLDKTGTEIYANKGVSAELIRLAGQPVIDIFKTEEMDISKPADKLDTIGSVLDRIYKIEIAYSGLTRSVKFEGTTLVEAEKWDGTYTQAIEPEMVTTAGKELYKVILPQADKGLATSGAGTEGSVRILGPAALPIASQALRMIATFQYHTYNKIVCQIPDYTNHEHSTDCMSRPGNLTLYLPGRYAEEGFNIISNTYTVNKAGLPFDRVIDVTEEYSFKFRLYWEDGQY